MHMRVNTARHIQCVLDCRLSQNNMKIAHTPKLALHAHTPSGKLAAQTKQLDRADKKEKRKGTNKEHLPSNAMQRPQRLCDG